MKRRRLVILLLIPLVVMCLGLLFAGWVMNTQGGAHWLLQRVTHSLNGQLSIGEVSGNLGDGLVVKDLNYEEEGLELVISRLETVVGLSLLPLKVKVHSLQTVWLSSHAILL